MSGLGPWNGMYVGSLSPPLNALREAAVGAARLGDGPKLQAACTSGDAAAPASAICKSPRRLNVRVDMPALWLLRAHVNRATRPRGAHAHDWRARYAQRL